jgi:hypothetical protein
MAGPAKILLSLEDEMKSRMVNTLDWTRPHTGIKSQQQFIRKAIDALCDDLEKRYNGGEPFPKTAANRGEDR